MKLDEQLAVLQAAKDGKQIQHRQRGRDQWSFPLHMAMDFQFDFKTWEYRIYEPPKEIKRYFMISDCGAMHLGIAREWNGMMANVEATLDEQGNLLEVRKI